MDEEDVDFAVTGPARSRLSSLFQSENPSGDVNQALTFTAPKQPKKIKEDNTQVSSAALKLIHAVAVHAYKLKDGNYANQGKLGCAVLGHHEAFNYKLLLYKGKQIPVNVVSITPNFIFHVQPNNYANFYDEKKENWSLNFDSENALFDFTKQVTLAKANSQGKSPTALVIQDLVKGEGQSLDNGDTADVKYTGWLLSNFTFGQVFDSNVNSESSFRVRLGKGKVIKGWNDGLLGMQKGGKRLLIIPADLAYGSEGMGSSVPPSSTLIFEIHVIKTKVARETSHSPSPIKAPDSVADKKPDVPPRQSFSHEDNIRMRGASISEQLTQSPKKDKAQLISRMAKMGTATLPFQGAIAAQVSSDSESEVEPPQPSSPAPQNISRTSSPKAFSRPRSRTNSGPTVTTPPVQPQPISASMPFHVSQPSSQMSLYAQSAMPSQQPFVCAATPYPTYQPTMPGQYAVPQSPYSMQNVPGLIPPVTTSMADSHLSLLISETRTQSTEVRMSLSKITDKVDSVIQKVDDLRLQGRSSSTGMPFMENGIILQNIERIIQENTRLKEDVEAKNSKIHLLNEKICDIFQRNQRFFEESNSMLEQKSDSLQTASKQSQEKILCLEQEKAKLQLDLSTTTIKLNTLEADLIKFQKLESELNQKVTEADKETLKQVNLLNDAKAQLNESHTQLNSLQGKIKSVEQENSQLNGKLQNMEEIINNSQGSSDLVDMYKKEIQEYKAKVEQLNSVINDQNILCEKYKDENEKIKLELDKNIKLINETQLVGDKNEKKMNAYEKQRVSYEEKIQQLEAELEMAQVLKRKYEIFQERTRALKETYEKKILELSSEVKQLQSMKSVATSPEFSVEIKRVMNRLYKVLQGKFESDSSYNGSKVLETVLQAIMGLTFQVLESKNQSSGDHLSSTEPDKKETILKEEEAHSVEISQSEFSQQNGVNEPTTETAASSELFENLVPTDKEQAREISNSELDGGAVPKETTKETNEDKSDLTLDNEKGKDVSSKDELTEQVGESVKRESPESNMQQPTSNIFSELLSGTEGTKIWRPQPPPLFDDDDDDDDDDDWLK